MAQTYTVDPYAGTGKTADAVMEDVNENFAALKSSFSGDSSPSNPVEGQFWLDTDDDILKQYIDGDWVSVYDTANEELLLGLADDSVDTDQIADSAVDTDQLAASAVTAAKLDANAVTGAKLPAYTAGDYLITDWSSASEDDSSYVLMAQWKVGRSGTVRVRLKYKNESTPLNGGGYIQIKKGGVAQYTGGPFTNTALTNGYYDLVVSSEDIIQVYIKITTTPLPPDFTVDAAIAVDKPMEVGRLYSI